MQEGDGANLQRIVHWIGAGLAEFGMKFVFLELIACSLD